jgi:DNA invertase Pin-like site-specific DNA recombinase
MRESDRYDQILMEGMIQQTLAKVSHLPGAKELMVAGTEVFSNPRKWGASVRRVGRSQLSMVERDGVLYLYSMGTAASEDLPDANAFIQELIKVVVTYSPRETWVSSFTRLTRSANYVGDLMKAFGDHPGLLHCEAEINLSTPEGKMLFQMLGMIAAMERDYIVRRHTAGRVAQWRRSDWIPNAYPPGYKVVDRKIVIDEDAIEATKAMLGILANSALSTAETTSSIGALGITTPAVQRLHGDEATIADARNPTSILDTLLGWVESYETGRHETLWPNPFPGVTDIAGVSIENIEGFDHGALRLVQEMPIPDGGWADQSIFDAIRSRIELVSLTGGASRSTVAPFSGLFRFDDGEYEYNLGTGNDCYSLLRRPLDPDRTFAGWHAQAEDKVERLGVVDRATWHRSMAEAIIEAVDNGLPAKLDVARFQTIGPLPTLDPVRARVRALQVRLKDEQAYLAKSVRNAQMADGDDVAEIFIEDVKHHGSEVARLEREIKEAKSGLAEPVLEETFQSSADLVAHAVAALAGTENVAPAALRDTLRSIFHDARWKVSGGTVQWEVTIELPHESGTVMLGPVRGKLENRMPTPKRSSARYLRKLTIDQLRSAGLAERAARSVAAAGQPTMTSVLLAHLRGTELPRGVDPGWARHIISVYSDPNFSWNMNRWRLKDELRVQVLHLIEANGEVLSVDEVVAAGVTSEQLRYLWRVIDAPSGDPILRRLVIDNVASVALLECPHCGGSTSHSVVTPETKPGVMCTRCWRTPIPSSPVFPSFYRTAFGN